MEDIRPYYVLHMFIETDNEQKEKYKELEEKKKKELKKEVYFDAGVDLYNPESFFVRAKRLANDIGDLYNNIACILASSKGLFELFNILF